MWKVFWEGTTGVSTPFAVKKELSSFTLRQDHLLRDLWPAVAQRTPLRDRDIVDMAKGF